jgi:PatG Domain
VQNRSAEVKDSSSSVTGSSQGNLDAINLDISPQNIMDKGCECGNKDGNCSCGKMQTASSSFVYAIGRIEPRFPNLESEKEFAQAVGRTETAGLTDPQAMQRTLSQKENRYLVRQMCWVLNIQGIPTYILTPHDPADYDRLVEALSIAPLDMDVNVVVGIRGPIVSPNVCNGLMIPIIIFDQVYSFPVESLIKAIPKPEKIPQRQFTDTAKILFDRVIQMSDNAGATDEHRAMNYLTVRYDRIYAQTAEMYGRDHSLSAIEVLSSPLSGVRKIVDVILSFTNRNTDVIEKYRVAVDVTGEFPFLVTKLSPYYNIK